MAQSTSVSRASAIRALQLELKMLHAEPVDGFFVRLADESNLFEWEVGIFGSPGTLYQGGYFKVSRYIFAGLVYDNGSMIECSIPYKVLKS